MTQLTHVLITRAPVEKAAAAIGEAVPVGRFADWTVVAMPLDITHWPTEAAARLSKGTREIVLGALDLGNAVGVAAAAKGKKLPLMWSQGWQRPTNAILDRRDRLGWEQAAKDLAKKAGRPEIAKDLGKVRNPGDGRREILDLMLSEAMRLLDIPAELRGVHSTELGPVTDMVIARR